MSDWRTYCRGHKNLQIDSECVIVVFDNGRQQIVRVRDGGEYYELSTIIVKRGKLEGIADVALRAWKRNRLTRLVGFRVDERGHLVGDAWMPKAGIQAAEFLLVLRRLAAESDRFEYLLTGTDVA
jgi:hypothetical protein